MVSLGCPKNLVDSEMVLGTLAANEYEVTNTASDAEVLIVNTCGFIDKAKKESVDTILEMTRHKNTGSCKKLIVTGCLVQGYVDELKMDLPEVDAFLGPADYPRIAEVVRELMDSCKKPGAPLIEVHAPVYLYDENSPRLLATPFYTAYLKMAEGCDHVCGFCAIPQLRGKLRSRKIESCVAEAKQLAKHGVRELNLISQDSSEYGRDIYGQPRLKELLEALDEVEALRWIRVHYLYPAFLSDELMKTLAAGKRLVKYIDLPLQHGDTGMLKSMRRPGSFESNLKLLRRFRELIPDVAIRSSFIVGYPGETKKQFETMLEFLKEAKLDRAGFFTYSQEQKTVSGSMPSQISDKIKRERQKEASLLAAELSSERLKEKLGREVEVLVEKLPGQGAQAPGHDGLEHGMTELSRAKSLNKNHYSGRTQWDAPDIDGNIHFTAPLNITLKPGQFVKVKIQDSDEHDLFGCLCP